MASSLEEIMKLTPTKEVRFKAPKPIARDEPDSKSAIPSKSTIPSFNWSEEYMKGMFRGGSDTENGISTRVQPSAPKTFSPEESTKRDNFIDFRDEMAGQKKEVAPININMIPQENLDSTAKQTILANEANRKAAYKQAAAVTLRRLGPNIGGMASATDEQREFARSIQAPDREIVVSQGGKEAIGYHPHAGMTVFKNQPYTYGERDTSELKITLPNNARIIPKDVEAAERYFTLMDGEKYTKRDKNTPYKITATDKLALDLIESDPNSPDGIVANFKAGYNEGRLMFDEGGMADLGFKMSNSNKDEWNDPKSEIRKQYEKLEYIRNNSTAGKSRDLIDATTNPIARFFYEGTSGLAQQAAMYGSALDESAKGAMAGAAVAGPAGIAAGVKTGFAYSMFKLEKGMAYIQYREAGMDHETASEMSTVAGAVNAAIEYFELSLLAKGLPSAVKLISKNIYNRIPNKILRGAISVGGAYAGTAGAEITQEGIQQMVTNIMQNRGFDKMNEEAGFDKYEIMPPKQIAGEMWEEMKAVTPTMAMMSFFGLPANFRNFRSAEFNIGVSKRAVDALDAIEKLESNPNLQTEDVQEYQKNLDVLMNYSAFVSDALRNDYLSKENRDKIQEVLILSNATIQKYTEKPSASAQEKTEAAGIKTEPDVPVKSTPKVGKKQGNNFYVHKSSETAIVDSERLTRAKQKVGDFDYDIVRVNDKTGEISFIKTDDFDGKTEPEIISIMTVKKDGTVVDETPTGKIIVDKARYVPDDYTGFDVQAAKDREAAWRKAGVNYDSTQIDNKDYFENHLRNVGLLSTKNEKEVYNSDDVPVEDEAVINPQSEEGRPGEESHGTAPKTGSTDSSRPQTVEKEEEVIEPKQEEAKFSQKMYRGTGKTREEIYLGTKYPVLGEGTYYAFNAKDAKRYGDNIEETEVNLNNPLIIKDDVDWRELTKEAGWKYPNPIGQDESVVVDGIKALKEMIIGKGYDGVIVRFADDTQGDTNMKTGNSVRTIRKVLAHDQVVSYKETKPAAQTEEKPVAKEKEKVDNEGKKVTRELRNKVYEILGPENANSKENRDRIDAALDDIVSNKLGIDDSYNALMDAVKGITLTEGIADSISSEAKALAKLVRDTKIKLTDTLRNNIADFEAYRKSILRIVRLSNDGRDIDTFYQELLDLYPEYFDTDITHPADQLVKIVDVIKSLEKKETFKLSDVLTELELAELYVVPILNEVYVFMKEGKISDAGRKEADRTSQPSKRDEGETPKPVSAGKKEKGSTGPKVESPKQVIADKIYEKIQAGTKFTSQELFDIADEAFGGTQGQGVYDVRTAFDAMELAVNRYLIDHADEYRADTPEQAIKNIEKLEELLSLLPTQGAKRTETMEKYQQFSTPPTIAYLANYVANVQKGETVLEPSAGVGGLVALPHGWGAKVYVNELEKGRYDTIQMLPFAGFYNQNAEQINNVLPDELKPTLVIMNPPFSTAAERTGNARKTENAKRHIEQALLKLEPNGRLVAIVGKGMSEDAATFKDWWKQIKGKYNVKANIRIDGSNYKKYGTTFDIQLLVIDKDGPTVGETLTGEYANLSDAVNALEVIRNERRTEIEPEAVVGDGERTPGRPGRMGAVSVPGATAGSRNVSGGKGAGGKGGVSGSPDGQSPKVEPEKDVSGNDRADRRTDNDKPDKSGDRSEDETVRSDGRNRVESSGKLPDELELADRKAKPDSDIIEHEDDVYTVYRAKKLNIKGAQQHPTDLVESAAMSAVDAPDITYVPKLDKRLVEKGILSDAQLEIISYAGQSHEKTLPDGKRQGFFIGDGTGVGKGREIAGIILDNFNQGRKRAVWISNNAPLLKDAIRDWTALGGKKEDIFPQSKIKAESDIAQKEGILFTTYHMLRSSSKKDKGKTRLQQIVDFFGKDYDGVIVFDEAHNMSNSKDYGEGLDKKKASEMGKAGVELQNLLPNARIVYASATGATEVRNLAYLTRLGLWGKGTSFKDVYDFISKIEAGGLAAMELVARDMKSLGVYAARNLSFKGVEYDTLVHELTPMQETIYNEMSKAWQLVLQNVEQVLEATNGNRNARAKAYAKSMFFSAMQRFYNQIITSMSMPSVVADIKKELGNGNSVVIQLTNTNEALFERRFSAAEDEGISLDDIDLTPTDTLIEYLYHGFPTVEYEEYIDDEGNIKSRPVVDANGNPVISKEAVRKRDELIEFVKQLKVPEGPLEILFNEFGAENIAEITGRSRRLVTDETGKKVLESRSEGAKLADEQDFQDGKKRILIFSDAGGTGRSYHADRNIKNQQRRIHYLLQPGWNAFKATQGFGRTHRSNQVVAPIFRLVTTNIAGQKRFTSTIARRLDQLGALTKGQRQAGSGVFSQRDNLENSIARDALQIWYKRLAYGGFDLDAKSVITKMGLYDKLYDQYGNYRENLEVVRDVSKFLNRILAIEVKEQNEIFETFESVLDDVFAKAVEAGTVDMGTENFITDKLEVKDEKVIYKDKVTGAETKYLQITASKRPNILDFDSVPTYNPKFVGLVRLNDSGEVRAVYRSANKTTRSGEVTESYNLLAPALEISKSNYIKKTLEEKTTPIPKSEWRKEWNRQIENTPEYIDSTLHVITGVLLPVWDKLPADKVKVMRIMDAQGKNQYLGRVIPASQIDGVLLQFNTHRTKEIYTSEQIYNKILNDNQVVYLRDFKQRLERRKVSGEYRIEIKGTNLWYFAQMPGIITERINFEYRYFVPTDRTKALPVLDKIMSENPVVEIKSNTRSEDSEYQSMTASSVVGQFYKPTAPASAQNAITPEVAKGPIKPISQIIVEISKAFGTPITSKRYSGRKSLGRYNKKYGFIETKYANTIGVVSHELGHHFDKVYSILRNHRQELKYMANKMEPEVKKTYKPHELPGEAMAEFMRLYLINPQGAYEFAELENNRNFYDIFESLISESDMKKLMAVRADILNFLAASVEEQAKTTIHSYGEKPKMSLEEKRMKLYSEWVNAYESFEVMNRKIKELTGREIAPSDNAYYLALQSQRGDSIAYWITHRELIDPQYNVIGESFSSLYKNIKKKERADFDLYLKLVHALDWMDHGKMVFSPDYSRSDIEAAISRLEARYPHFSTTANRIYEWWDKFVRAWLVDTGFMEAEVYETLREMYPHYVPNFRVEDGVVNTVGGKKAKAGFSNQTNPVRRASEKGSARDTYSATQSMIMEIDRYVKSVLRRDVMLALHRNYNNPDYAEVMGDFMRKVPPEKQRHVYNAMDLKEKLKGDLFANEINRLSPEERERFEKLSLGEQIKYLHDTGIDVTIDNVIDDYIVFYTPKKISTDASIVTVVDKGKTYFYEVFDKYMAQALTNLMPKQLDGFMKYLAELKRVMTILATGGNPIFGLTSNIYRDIPQAYIMGKYTNPIEFAWALVDATKSIITRDEKYKRYKRAGGGFESPVGTDVKYLRKTIRKMSDKNTGVIGMLDAILGLIEEINNIIETVPRLTIFNKIIDEGGDTYDNRLEAMYQSSDVTVNFQRRGSGGEKQIASTLVQVVPFLNTGIQGLDKFYRGMTDPETRKTTIIKALATISLFAIAQALYYANDDDYEELQDYYKNNYWLIKYAPGKFIRIPKTRELGVLFGVTFERAIREMLHGEEDNGKALIMAFKDNFMVPTAWVLAPVYDALANRTWYGGNIVSERDKILMTQGYYNDVYDDTTSRIAVFLAKILPDVEALGPINTPKGIEYLIKQYTGGLGQILLPATTPSSEGPIDGILRKMTVDVAYSSKYIDEFYKIKAKLDAADRVYKDRGKMTDDYNDQWRLAFQRFNNGFKDKSKFNKDSPPLPESAEKILRGEKGFVGLSAMWAEIRAINNDDTLTPEQKHDKIRKIRLEINEVTKQLVQAYEEAMKK